MRAFSVRCRTEDPPLDAEAEGGSLRAAEQAAAEQVLAKIEVLP
jgi:dsRNA-specific ribonuclease